MGLAIGQCHEVRFSCGSYQMLQSVGYLAQ